MKTLLDPYEVKPPRQTMNAEVTLVDIEIEWEIESEEPKVLPPTRGRAEWLSDDITGSTKRRSYSSFPHRTAMWHTT